MKLEERNDEPADKWNLAARGASHAATWRRWRAWHQWRENQRQHEVFPSRLPWAAILRTVPVIVTYQSVQQAVRMVAMVGYQSLSHLDKRKRRRQLLQMMLEARTLMLRHWPREACQSWLLDLPRLTSLALVSATRLTRAKPASLMAGVERLNVAALITLDMWVQRSMHSYQGTPVRARAVTSLAVMGVTWLAVNVTTWSELQFLTVRPQSVGGVRDVTEVQAAHYLGTTSADRWRKDSAVAHPAFLWERFDNVT